MKILLFDNYDSFTYNLCHMLKECGAEVCVRRNDKMELAEAEPYDKIVLSPGPGIPEEAGILLPLIREYAPRKSMLGVCLGHQAIAQAFGARLENLSDVFHGVQSEASILDPSEPLFAGLPGQITVGRYHSWSVSDEGLPDCLEVTARDCAENRIMALRHKAYDVRGVQFHPESVLTPEGRRIIENWLKL